MLTAKEKRAKKNWLNDLRSGKYKQARGILYDTNTKGFCCLGVMQHRVMDGRVELESTMFTRSFRYNPSRKFYKAFPEFDWVANHEAKLVNMNDEEEASLEEIADYVEREWV